MLMVPGLRETRKAPVGERERARTTRGWARRIRREGERGKVALEACAGVCPGTRAWGLRLIE